MKNIVLIATGGTIASAREAGGAVNAGLTGETLLAALHAPLDAIAVTVENFAAAGSYALDLATVLRLCRRIDAVLADAGVDGVVVTHGTDTMEESAFLAWLLVKSEKPVVFTGAQRHAASGRDDGRAGLDAGQVHGRLVAGGERFCPLGPGRVGPARLPALARTPSCVPDPAPGRPRIGPSIPDVTHAQIVSLVRL